MPEAAGTPQLPHGIMGLQEQAFPWMLVLAVGLGLLLLALIVWLLVRRLRQKSPSSSAPVAPVPMRTVDPWTRMDETLKKLDVREPWTREACEDYFFQLSFVLREALELRTGLPITGQTLAETRAGLEKSPGLSANFQQELLKFLSLSEQMKFAGQWMSAAEAVTWREKVRGWWEQLRSGVLS